MAFLSIKNVKLRTFAVTSKTQSNYLPAPEFYWSKLPLLWLRSHNLPAGRAAVDATGTDSAATCPAHATPQASPSP